MLIVCAVYILPVFIATFMPNDNVYNTISYGIAITWSFRVKSRIELFLNSYIDSFSQTPAYGRLAHFFEHVAVESEDNKVPFSKEKFNYTPITFSNVSLSVLGKKILKRVSFEIQSADTIAIIGEGGSGKHSLVNMMLGHYRADYRAEGSNISLFGSSIDYIKEVEIRQIIVYLVGDPPLYTGTVRDNIDPYSTKKKREIIDVLVELDLLGILTLGKKEVLLLNNEKLTDVLGSVTPQSGRSLDLKYVNKTVMKTANIFGISSLIGGKQGKDVNEANKYWNFFSKELGIYDIQVDECKKKEKLERKKEEQEDLEDQMETERKQLKRKSEYKAPKAKVAAEGDTDIIDKLERLEREVLARFLSMRITGNSCPMPVRARRCLKMARAMLGNGKIFIMDQEAMSFGKNTNKQNQELLRKKSKKNVVISIVRSFENLLCYDKIIYMKGGELKDFGDTKDLIQKSSSNVSQYIRKAELPIFRKLYKDVGPLLQARRKIK